MCVQKWVVNMLERGMIMIILYLVYNSGFNSSVLV